MLANEDPGTWDLATNGRSLQDAQEQQQDGRPRTQVGVGRQQPDAQSGQCHEQHTECEHLFATT